MGSVAEPEKMREIPVILFSGLTRGLLKLHCIAICNILLVQRVYAVYASSDWHVHMNTFQHRNCAEEFEFWMAEKSEAATDK